MTCVCGRRRAVGVPVVPRRQVHHRVGMQHLRFEVIAVLIGDAADATLPRRVQRRAAARRGRITSRQRLDEGALACRHAVGCAACAINGTRGANGRHGIHAGVDVRAQGERHSPRAHRARAVEPLALLERADRLRVVEGPREAKSLVEVPLGPRVSRRDRVVVRPEVLVQRNRGSRRAVRVGVLCLHGGGREDERGSGAGHATRVVSDS